MSYNTNFEQNQNMGAIGTPNPMQSQYERYMAMMNQQQQGNSNRNFNFNSTSPQQSQTVSNTNVNWVVVENLTKAKEQIVPNNNTIWMRDSIKPFIYIKSVDSFGTPDFKILKTEDVTDVMLNNNGDIQEQNKNNVSIEGFVPVENFNELVNKFGTLNDTVGNLQQKIGAYEQIFSQQFQGQQKIAEQVPKVVEDIVKPKVTRQTNSQKVGE